jgi:hypothetical protein
MFTHPALLRELTLMADLLRRSGEAEWSRRAVQAADGVRKAGWTEAGAAHARGLFAGDRSLHSVSFGAEHHRWVGGEPGVHRANDRLERHRLKLLDLMNHPVQAPEEGPRKRSPDLA